MAGTDTIQLNPGDHVAGYRLEQLLGRGSYAQVWLVTRLADGERRALKLLSKAGAAPQDVASFLNEARLALALDHPNIVGVEDVGESVAMAWLAMDYVGGGSLHDLIRAVAKRRLRFSTEAVLALALDLARALDHAYAAVDTSGQPLRIVHRDLKPANVLLTLDGRARVSDFGLAKAVGNTGETTAGMIKGSPAYVAPESWEGGRDFGPPVDFFSLGCIVWEVIMLRRLFDGASIPLVYSQVSEREGFEEARMVAAHQPELVDLLSRLLDRRPRGRPQRAAELVTERERLARGRDLEGALKELLEDVRRLPEVAGDGAAQAASGELTVSHIGPSGDGSSTTEEPWPLDSVGWEESTGDSLSSTSDALRRSTDPSLPVRPTDDLDPDLALADLLLSKLEEADDAKARAERPAEPAREPEPEPELEPEPESVPEPAPEPEPPPPATQAAGLVEIPTAPGPPPLGLLAAAGVTLLLVVAGFIRSCGG